MNVLYLKYVNDMPFSYVALRLKNNKCLMLYSKAERQQKFINGIYPLSIFQKDAAWQIIEL